MNLSEGYFITAEIRVNDSHMLERTKEELKKLQRKTLEEDGCDVFSIHQDGADPLRFILWERFESEAAFKKHFEYQHTKEYV
jgi:quinol monooxygenase YgiN